MDWPGFCGGSYQSQAFSADAELSVNWYCERPESPGSNSPLIMLPTPGVEEISDAGAGFGRAHIFIAWREFAVIGTAFVEIDQFGAITSRGTVAIDGNPATISSNGDGGDQLFITSGANGYCFNLTTNVLTQVVALDGKATMGGQIDGYFIVLDANTSTFYISALLDGLTWATGTDFAQRTTAPDPWIGMAINGQYLWLFGSQTTEVWYDSGASPFPFARHPSGFVPYGIAAPFASAVANNVLVWLGQSKIGDGQVLRANGFAAEVVSTYPLQYEINGYATISDAIGDAYNDFGHTFFTLTFPSADKAHTWDSETLLWHNRLTWVSESNDWVAWRPRYHAFAFGEHRMLDAATGAVYRFDYREGATDVDDRPIRRQRRAPALVKELRFIQYPGLELHMDVGLGRATGQGSDPQVMLRVSGDGGRTWSNEMWRSAGAVGQWGKRVRWERLGRHRQFVAEITVTDPIPWRLVAAYLTPNPKVLGRQRAA